MLFHKDKGLLKKYGKKYSTIGNKTVDVFIDENGQEHKLDGTEKTMDDHIAGLDKFIEKDKKDKEVTKKKDEKKKKVITKEQKEKDEKEAYFEMSEHGKEMRQAELLDSVNKISSPIVKAINGKDVKSDISVNNLNKELTSAVETLKIELRGLKTDDVDLSSIEGKLDALVAKEFPEPPKQTDYTSVLNEIKKGLPKDTDTSRIEKLLKKLDKPVFEIPSKLIKDNRIKVEVDRISMGGSGGATGVGLSTEAKQDDMITELQDLAVTVDNVGSAVISGRKTVTTAGTAEILKTDTTLTQGVIIMALKTNTNNIFVGDSSLDKDSDKQTELEPGESTAVAVDNINLIYIDVTTNGEGVSFIGS